MNLKERFLSKVKKTRGCWVWTSTLDSKGYGQLSIRGRSGKIFRAHRVSYELFVGKIPDGLFILHSCDNRKCVNPKHLRPGTQKENIQDALKRNRLNPAHGEDAGRAVLTAAQVKWIRENSIPYCRKMGRAALAKKFNVAASTITEAILKNNWRHL